MMPDSETRILETRDGVALTSRRLTRRDATALASFNTALSPASRRWFLPHPYDAATLAKALRRAEDGDDLLLGLFDAECMVGYFFLWYATRRVPLLGIGLADAFQGRGLGRQMMRLLIDTAESLGCEAIELTTMMDNDRAYALYERMGFTHIADVRNLQGDGQWVVERAMIYRLKPDALPMDEPHQPPV